MPDLTFTFQVEHDVQQLDYKVFPSQYIYDEFVPELGVSICHIGVVEQIIAEADHFLLGEMFM